MPRRSTSALLALPALVLASACTSPGRTTTADASGSAHASPAAPPATSAELAALAGTRPPTTLPPATGTLADAEHALAATLPKTPPAVRGLDPTAVRSGLEFAAKLVAVTRADRSYLCGPATADPVAPLSTPSLRTYLSDPAQADNKKSLEATVSSASGGTDCGPLRWVGPGVVPGPQEWTVQPGTDGATLHVRWEGSFGYALAGTDGTPEPWGTSPVVRYGLARSGERWALTSWRAWNSAVGAIWPPAVPVPDGYLPAPDAPAGDPKALAAVRAAAAAWGRQTASQVVFEGTIRRLDAAGATDAGGSGDVTVTVTVQAAPSRGDATGRLIYTGGKARTARAVWLGRGRRYLAQADPHALPLPGRTLPTRHLWDETDAAEPTGGVGADPAPFSVVATLDAADAAATADCPVKALAARPTACYTVAVRTGQGDAPDARFIAGGRLAGNPFVVATVGLAANGLPAFVGIDQTVRVLGADAFRPTAAWTFRSYAASPPPLPPAIGPATVARSADIAG